MMERQDYEAKLRSDKRFWRLLYLYLLVGTALLFLVSYSSAQTFSNTTVSACNSWDSGNTYPGLTKTIAVTGLPTLGTGAGQVVLKQVNIQLGTTACKGNLSSYSARLVSPTGTIIQLFTNFTSTSTSMWMNIHYRDHASLERVQDYATTTEQNYWPWSIGYYRTETTGVFSTVNGENPNGNWSLQIIENTTSEVSFERVDLEFGTALQVTDITASNANDNCSGAQCVDNQSVVIGTNSGYVAGDPNYPGNTFGGCSWNGNNNNSAWFQFTASATSAYLTISGIANTGSTTSSDTQLLIARRTGDCSTGSWLSVPTGGCPDDEAINNGAYLTTNGGVTISGNVYVNGISANAEFNLSGLTVGATYYLYIDGNGGTPSSFYIEAVSGCQNCALPLPVELLYFDATLLSSGETLLDWVTESERENAYFLIERSSDNASWQSIGKIAGAGSSTTQNSYSFTDTKPMDGMNYYRLQQIDVDGKSAFSEVKTIYNPIFYSVFPNPTNSEITITGESLHSDVIIQILDCVGQTIYTSEMKQGICKVDMGAFASGVYYVQINKEALIRLIKE